MSDHYCCKSCGQRYDKCRCGGNAEKKLPVNPIQKAHKLPARKSSLREMLDAANLKPYKPGRDVVESAVPTDEEILELARLFDINVPAGRLLTFARCLLPAQPRADIARAYRTMKAEGPGSGGIL